MRLWTLHPCLLDTKGLGALWQEGLLAQSLLQRGEGGYYNHTQLERWKDWPIKVLQSYLWYVWEEATKRSFNYNRSKLPRSIKTAHHFQLLDVTWGQVQFELNHLLAKLEQRNPTWMHYVRRRLRGRRVSDFVSPVFKIARADKLEPWEKTTNELRSTP